MSLATAAPLQVDAATERRAGGSADVHRNRRSILRPLRKISAFAWASQPAGPPATVERVGARC